MGNFSSTCQPEQKGLNSQLIAEAIRVFELGDKDHNGQLDMAELANVRNSKDFANAMMGQWDKDLSGTINKEEWLDYFTQIFQKNEKTASIVLKLYEKQIGENKNIRLQTTKISPAPPEPSIEGPEYSRCTLCW